MATRRYSVNPQDPIESVTEAAGSATATKAIEVTFDLATTVVNVDTGDGAATRGLTQLEVIDGLKKIISYIESDTYPPA